MNVPKPPLGYWARIYGGAKTKPTPLPQASADTVTFVDLYPSRTTADRFEILSKIEKELLPENQVEVPYRLIEPHPLVKKIQEFVEEHEFDQLERVEIPHERGFLNLSVSRAQLDRALRIINALILALEKRGYDVVVSKDHWREETRFSERR